MKEPIPKYATELRENLIGTHLPNELSDFVSVHYPPIDDSPVLVIREADKFSPCKYEVLTARYLSSHRGWRDCHGMIIMGQPLLGWRNALRWLQPVQPADAIELAG